MARKISVYVDENLHRLFKTAASMRGQSLSEFMIGAAKQALSPPSRQAAATKMDRVREALRLEDAYSAGEIRAMREEGRRTWPRE